MKDARIGDKPIPGAERPAHPDRRDVAEGRDLTVFPEHLPTAGRIALHAHRFEIDASIPVLVAAVDQDEDSLQQPVGQGEDRTFSSLDH